MQKLMKERLRELKVRQRRRRQMGIIAAFFGVLVIGGVVWGMTRPGVAMTGDATCGIEEHKHSDKCYENVLVCDEKESEGHKHDDGCYKTEEVLVCDKEETEANPEEGIEGHTHDKGCYEEKKELVCKEEESKGHTHTDKCYKKELACGKEEHTHEEDCYIDRSADVEKKSDWDKQYKSTKWKDAWGEDLVTAAEKQVGYKESTKNYKKVNGDQKGYTRYGEFSGEPYADWDAAFVNFCIHYAGISKSDVFPNTTDTNKWYNKFSKVNGSFLTAPEGYEPEKGDIVFFEKKKGETDFTVGIVSSFDKDKKEIKVIEGNVDNEVKEEKYGTGDSQIFAYIKVTELEQAFKGMQPDDAENKEEEPAETEEPAESEETEGDETDESSPAFDSEYEGDGVIIRVKADAGVVPEGAELSVMPIEKKKITSDMSAEEKEEAEKVNEQYDMTNEKLNEESEKNEQELQGFLAYDISFMLDGQEIEPNGEVKVTMNFKEAVAPEGVSENAQVAVNHLKENGNGGVKVENLTEADATTIQTAEKDAAVEKVELVANDFSVFTISWVVGSMRLVDLNVQFVDEKGNILPVSELGEVKVDYDTTTVFNLKDVIGDKWNNITVNGTLYEPFKMWINNIEVDKVQFDTNGIATFMNSNDVDGTFTCSFMEVPNHPLQIVFRPKVAAEIEIENNVETTGCLDVKLSEEALAKIEQAKLDNKPIQYEWFKIINGKENPVTNTVYDENLSSIVGEYGESLNVALDNRESSEIKATYKVKLSIGEGDEKEVIGESDLESVLYYSEVRNGSFEVPKLNSGGTYDWFSQDSVPGWYTTARNPDYRIEIARVGKTEEGAPWIHPDYIATGGYSLKTNWWAAEGDQFAELNASATGSLYQDVLTVKGVPLNYSFSHMARPSTCPDSMYLVIAPTWIVKRGVSVNGKIEGEVDTQDEVTELIRLAKENPKEYPGVYVEEYTAGEENGYVDWEEHNGVYTPQYNLNRFYFVSNEKYTPTMGNFIDNVSFSQTLPEPKPKSFNFAIKKTITGLSDEQVNSLKEKLKFKISIKDSMGASAHLKNSEGETIIKDGDEISANDSKMTWGVNNGVYTGVYNYKDVPIEEGGKYKITVEEISSDVGSYELKPTVAIITSGKDGNFEPLNKKEVEVQNQSNKGLHFKNVYSRVESVWKVIKRSSSNDEKRLEGAKFTLTDETQRLVRFMTGETDATGEIKWSDSDGNPCDLRNLDGEYTLRETRAPEGYSCNEKGWTLKFDNGKLDESALEKLIGEMPESEKKYINFIKVPNSSPSTYEISIYNDRVYELPSTGGNGIYLYMFSGILLMAGGLLMTYKNRRRGVLRS